MRKTLRLFLVVVVIVAGLAGGCSSSNQPSNQPAMQKVRIGVSPFQDTLVPTVGYEKGWYNEEGIDAQFSLLGWTEVMQALSAGHVDVAVNNIYAVIADHQQDPNLVFYYGLNPFDNGAALMIRPNGGIRPLAEMLKTYSDRPTAIKMTAMQLKGKTIITTGGTDMEQSVLTAARKADLYPNKDFKILNLDSDEGLAAFLRGDGDAYLGGIPQRTTAGNRGMVEMLTGADLGPPPINGLVTTRAYARDHQDELLKILHVWFRIVNYINNNLDEGANIIVKQMNAAGSDFTVADFKKFWNNYESYPASPAEVQRVMLDPNGRNYWKAQWDDCNLYLKEVLGKIKDPVPPEGIFLMEQAHSAYINKYGEGP